MHLAGLIRWKIVVHGFIDGKSRFITGIRAHNNNRAQTVLDLFQEAVRIFGRPSRVRGDHGTENLLVALYMEEVCGVARGSYIWGRKVHHFACLAKLILNAIHRSVHNIRIERLWVDFTAGVGAKWKRLFQDLEAYDDLDPTDATHIWLLHHLFLEAINQDIQDWAGAWNNHVMTLPGERSRSPRDMFYFGMIQHGPRGVELANEELEDDVPEDDIEGYGIDWQDLDNPQIRAHHEAANGHEGLDDQDIAADDMGDGERGIQVPNNLADVRVEEPVCPLTAQQVAFLDAQLDMQALWQSRTVEGYRLRWRMAFDVARAMNVL